jgi:hypothetical protein
MFQRTLPLRLIDPHHHVLQLTTPDWMVRNGPHRSHLLTDIAYQLDCRYGLPTIAPEITVFHILTALPASPREPVSAAQAAASKAGDVGE